MRVRPRWEGIVQPKGALRTYIFSEVELVHACDAWAVEDATFRSLWERYIAAKNGLGRTGKRLRHAPPKLKSSLLEWTIPVSAADDNATLMSAWREMQTVGTRCLVNPASLFSFSNMSVDRTQGGVGRHSVSFSPQGFV
jgi:hypothetical protein